MDGITEDESLAIQSRGSISNETGTGSTFVAMPFLESIEPPDSHALMSLDILSYEAPEAFDDILSQPVITDGVSDSEAPTLALLHDVHSQNPSLVSTLLSPNGIRVEQRDIDLPLAGRVWLGIVRTREGVARAWNLITSRPSGRVLLLGKYSAQVVVTSLRSIASSSFTSTSLC